MRRAICVVLLVCVQAGSQVNNFSATAALYWTLVGLWLVPGNVLEHRTVAQGRLMDCRTGVILGTASGDCRRKRACPAAFLDIARDQLAAETPAKALADLQAACARLIKRTTEAAADRAGRVRSSMDATDPAWE